MVFKTLANVLMARDGWSSMDLSIRLTVEVAQNLPKA